MLECSNASIWDSGIRGKRFEGSRLRNKIILGFRKRWDSWLRRKNLDVQGSGYPFFGTDFSRAYSRGDEWFLLIPNYSWQDLLRRTSLTAFPLSHFTISSVWKHLLGTSSSFYNFFLAVYLPHFIICSTFLVLAVVSPPVSRPTHI